MIKSLLLLWISLYGVQHTQDKSLVIIAQHKISSNKKYYFHTETFRSMKFKSDPMVYGLTKIEKITQDSVFILKRIYYSDTHIEYAPGVFAINDIQWMNWDGIPRKKVRSRFYRFSVNQVVK